MVGFHWSDRDWSLYPFVPENETEFVVFSNWDLDSASNPDVSGASYDKSNAQTETSSLGAINPSGNGVAENTSYAITGGENNDTWKAKVYDMTGNPVKTLADGTYTAGTHSIAWEGKSKRGRPVAQDVYFIVITGDVRRKVFKVLVVR